MPQARNYRVSYRLRAWSPLDMTVALRDLETTFSANQISVYQTCCSLIKFYVVIQNVNIYENEKMQIAVCNLH